MTEFVVLFRNRQYLIKRIPCFSEFVLPDEGLRPTFERHIRESRIRRVRSNFNCTVEERKGLCISLNCIEAISEHFERSNLTARVPTRHRGKKRVTNQLCSVPTFALQECNDAEFGVCTCLPLGFSQTLRNLAGLGPIPFRSRRTDFYICVALLGETPKSQLGIAFYNGVIELLTDHLRDIYIRHRFGLCPNASDASINLVPSVSSFLE